MQYAHGYLFPIFCFNAESLYRHALLLNLIGVVQYSSVVTLKSGSSGALTMITKPRLHRINGIQHNPLSIIKHMQAGVFYQNECSNCCQYQRTCQLPKKCKQHRFPQELTEVADKETPPLESYFHKLSCPLHLPTMNFSERFQHQFSNHTINSVEYSKGVSQTAKDNS